MMTCYRNIAKSFVMIHLLLNGIEIKKKEKEKNTSTSAVYKVKHQEVDLFAVYERK